MKKKIILILVLIGTLVSGCSKLSEDSYFIQGKEKLESHEYDEALTLLSQVLDENPENESARAMYMQARKMKSAKIYEENNDYDKAIKELDFIVNIDNGSKKIKRESINKKAELEKLQQTYEKEALERKENAKKVSKEDINRIQSQIIYENNKKQEEEKKEEDKKEENEIEGETNENQPSNQPTIDKEENSKPGNDVEQNTETSTDAQ